MLNYICESYFVQNNTKILRKLLSRHSFVFIVKLEKERKNVSGKFKIFHGDKTIFIQFDSFLYLHLPSANIKRIP